jgi:nitric oxide reductase activation protein
VPGEAIYVESVRRRRDLSVLVLLDVSGSAGEPGASGRTVHDHQVRAAAALTTALHDLGDRVALYGFRSMGRQAVQLLPVKRFGARLDGTVLRRLGGLVPGAYTRLGAAIRHGAAVLEAEGGTSRRLLVVLSDGFAYDHGYEGAYGEADARRALAEARRRGTACLCLSVAATTDPEALRRVFGTAAHASVPHAGQLAATVGPLFRAALQLADVQRRRSQRRQRTRARARDETDGVGETDETDETSETDETDELSETDDIDETDEIERRPA